MKKVTQKDIADALGISVSTVGLVVGHGKSPLRKHLKKETVLRIEKKAREMGYHPDRAAQIMRRGRTNLIVFLNMGHSELVHREAYQIGRVVHELGYNYQVVDAYWWVGEGNHIIDLILGLRPEGIIIAGAVQSENMDFSQFQRAGISAVSLDCRLPGIPCVRHDVFGVIRELVGSCLRSGCKRPVLIYRRETAPMSWQIRERRNGFIQAIRDAGLPEPEDCDLRHLEVRGNLRKPMLVGYSSSPSYFDPFRPGMEAAEVIGTAADALICSNDQYATGALTHYLRAGVRVPDEIALSGFDNLSYTTQGITALTTVDLPIDAMCETAMRFLTARMGGDHDQPEDLVLPSRIVWRESMVRDAALDDLANV